MPEELPSKIHTGSLLDNLETATRAEVLGLRYTKLSYQKNPIQKELTYTQQLLDPRWKAKRDLILHHVWKTYNDPELGFTTRHGL